ncbi:DNA-binding protein [Tetragenococcus halophilus]|uniref:DNA-binding protein n=1 Tax=Tetragenococcus halophilus TaxID=51669 RepID=UPI0020963642|nr:DNA-binding protein [Tetragenococcus halophilus]MCO7026823.1 DNA-binding protein [Tetragenococcus halophilus]
MEVMLTEDQQASLQRFVYETTKQAIAEAQHNAGVDKQFMRKGECAEWLGISRNSLNKLEREGMPSIVIDGITFFNRDTVTEYLLSKQQ